MISYKTFFYLFFLIISSIIVCGLDYGDVDADANLINYNVSINGIPDRTIYDNFVPPSCYYNLELYTTDLDTEDNLTYSISVSNSSVISCSLNNSCLDCIQPAKTGNNAITIGVNDSTHLDTDSFTIFVIPLPKGFMNCSLDTTPYIKSKIPIIGKYLGVDDREKICWKCVFQDVRGEDIKCMSYLYYGDDLIQQNPEQSFIENLGSVTTFDAGTSGDNTQVARVFFDNKDLRPNITVTAKVLCQSTDENGEITTYSFAREINPNYKDMYMLPIEGGSWIIGNVGQIILIIFILLASILVVAGLRRWFFR